MPSPKKVPSARRKREEEEDDLPTRKVRKKPVVDDDDDEEEDAPKKRSSTSSKGTVGTGWGKVANKKVVDEETKDRVILYDFFLEEGESARIQFIDDEPYCYDGHGVTVKGKFQFLACQKSMQKHCAMCSDGIKTSWKAAFRILDFRGKYDKKKKKYDWGDPVPRLWKVSNTVASQLQAQVEGKKKRVLSKTVFDVTRTGSGKSTSYNIEIALDEDDEKVETVDFEGIDDLPVLEDLCAPLSDDALDETAFTPSSF